MKLIVLALALTIACGSARDDATGSAPTTAPPTAPGLDATSQAVTVRLLGARAPGAVRVRVAALELSVDGQALPAPVAGGELDLGNAQQAWQVTTFALPAGARRVAIKLQLQPEGVVERNGMAQALDLTGPPLTWVADAAQLRTRSKVVLELDLARSLVERCDRVALLPDFTVRY